jgi:hypothetical protein
MRCVNEKERPMESCALESRDYLDEARRIALGERSVLGLPILAQPEHCKVLYKEVLRLKAIISTHTSEIDDIENQKEVDIRLGKVSP